MALSYLVRRGGLVLATWFLVLGAWCLEFGIWYLVLQILVSIASK